MPVVALLPLLLWAAAFALAALLIAISEATHRAFDGLPWPLSLIGGPISRAFAYVGQALKVAGDAAASAVSSFLNFALQLAVVVFELPVFAVDAVVKGLTYMWHTALPARIETSVAPARGASSATSAKLTALERTVKDNLAFETTHAAAVAREAREAAEAYARTQVAGLHETMTERLAALTETTIPNLIARDLRAGGPIQAAIAASVAAAPFLTQAELNHDVARELEPGGAIARAIAAAVASAGAATPASVEQAITAGLAPGGVIARAIASSIPAPAPSTGVTAGEVAQEIAAAIAGARPAAGVTSGDVAQAIADAVSADLAPGGTIAQAIAASLPAPVVIGGDAGGLSIGDLAATVGTLATSLAAVEAIPFIRGAECRSKVGGICGVDSSSWLGLLEGLAALGFAFSLAELAEVAGGLIGELAPVLHEAA